MPTHHKKPNGQQFIFAKPYMEWPHYALEPDKFEEGQTIYECQDSWFEMSPDSHKRLRFSPAKIRQLQFMGHLVEHQNTTA